MSPQIYKAFVNGGFRDVMLVSEIGSGVLIPLADWDYKRQLQQLRGRLEAAEQHVKILQDAAALHAKQVELWRSHGYPSERIESQAQTIAARDKRIRRLEEAINATRDFLGNIA